MGLVKNDLGVVLDQVFVAVVVDQDRQRKQFVQTHCSEIFHFFCQRNVDRREIYAQHLAQKRL